MGPIWNGGDCKEPEFLASCYRESLEVLASYQLRTIAFPGISTGVYGFPLGLATAIAVRTVRNFLVKHQEIQRVIFCCFSDDAVLAYKSELSYPKA